MKKLVVAALLSAVAATSFAQQAIPPQGEVIDVQITNVDVVVTDAKGQRVTGLTKDDFEVLEDGKKKQITNLSEVSRTTDSLKETIQPAPRRILLIVDNGSIELSARRKVFDATRATLDRLFINPSDRVSIATISRSVKQRIGWTSNKKEILDALDAVEKDAILPHPGLLELERALERIIDDANASASSHTLLDPNGTPVPGSTAGQTNSGAGGRLSTPPVEFSEVIEMGRNYSGIATNESKQLISSLNAVMTAFAAVPGGRKIAILVGGGLPLNAGDAVFQRIENVREQMELGRHSGFKGARTASTVGQTAGYDVTELVDALTAAARLKGVAFYAVNPEFGDRQVGGASSRGFADYGSEFVAMKGVLDGYNRLSTGTGGKAMIGRPADQILTEILNDLDSYYSLAYSSSGPLNPKSQIVVKVKKGLTARSTLASGTISRDWEVSDQVLANLQVDQVNPLNISLVVDPAVVNGDKKTIPMKIIIPVSSLMLVEDNGQFATKFTVYISVGNEGGNGSEPTRQEKTFRWPEDAITEVKEQSIALAMKLEVVGDERDRVSIGVLDQNSGSAGFTRAMLN